MEFCILHNQFDYMRYEGTQPWDGNDINLSDIAFIRIFKEVEAGNVLRSRNEQSSLQERLTQITKDRLEAVKRRPPNPPQGSFSHLSLCGDSLVRKLLEGMTLEVPVYYDRTWSAYPYIFAIKAAYGRSYSEPACQFMTPSLQRERTTGLHSARYRVRAGNESLWNFFGRGDLVSRRLEKVTFPTIYRTSIFTIALTFTCQLRTIALAAPIADAMTDHLAKFSSLRSEPQLIGRHLNSLTIECTARWTVDQYTKAAILLASVAPQLRHLRLGWNLRAFKDIRPRLQTFKRLRSLSLVLTPFRETLALLCGTNAPLKDCFPWANLESLHLEFVYQANSHCKKILDYLVKLSALKELSLKISTDIVPANLSAEMRQLKQAVSGLPSVLTNLQTFRLIDGTKAKDIGKTDQSTVILYFLPHLTPLLAEHLSKLILVIPAQFIRTIFGRNFSLVDFKVLKTLIFKLKDEDKLSRNVFPLDFIYQSKVIISQTVTSLTLKGATVLVNVHLANIGQAFPSLTELNFNRFKDHYHCPEMQAAIRDYLPFLVTLRFLTRRRRNDDENTVFWMKIEPFLMFLCERSRQMGQPFTLHLSLDQHFHLAVIRDNLIYLNKGTKDEDSPKDHEVHYAGLTLQ